MARFLVLHLPIYSSKPIANWLRRHTGSHLLQEARRYRRGAGPATIRKDPDKRPLRIRIRMEDRNGHLDTSMCLEYMVSR